MSTSLRGFRPFRTAPNTVLSVQDVYRRAPSVFAAEAHSSRSEKFVPVSTANVLDALLKEGYVVTDAQQSRCRDADRRDFTKHLVRLRHRDQLANPTLVGGSVPELLITNANDGASAFNVGFGVFRLVCSNGLVVGRQLANTSVRHVGRSVIDDVIEGTYRVLETSDEVLGRIERWSGIQLAQPQQLQLAQKAAEARWGVDEAGNLQAPINNVQQLLRPNRIEDRLDDAWTVINRIQENIVRGGVRGHSANGRRTSTRAITGVDENLRVNRAIWTLAEELIA